MEYREMKRIFETVEELESLSFDTLEQAKEWAKLFCSNVFNESEDSFDFDYEMLTGSFYKTNDGEIELSETLTVYDEHGEPKFDIERLL